MRSAGCSLSLRCKVAIMLEALCRHGATTPGLRASQRHYTFVSGGLIPRLLRILPYIIHDS